MAMADGSEARAQPYGRRRRPSRVCRAERSDLQPQAATRKLQPSDSVILKVYICEHARAPGMFGRGPAERRDSYGNNAAGFVC